MGLSPVLLLIVALHPRRLSFPCCCLANQDLFRGPCVGIISLTIWVNLARYSSRFSGSIQHWLAMSVNKARAPAVEAGEISADDESSVSHTYGLTPSSSRQNQDVQRRSPSVHSSSCSELSRRWSSKRCQRLPVGLIFFLPCSEPEAGNLPPRPSASNRLPATKASKPP